MTNKAQTLVTKQSIQKMIDDAQAAMDSDKLAKIIGRALLVLFERQTAHEQRANDTEEHNNVGFASCDAKQGSISAKTFKARGTLLPFQVERWTRRSRGGYAYICKYHRQLNEAAIERARAKGGP